MSIGVAGARKAIPNKTLKSLSLMAPRRLQITRVAKTRRILSGLTSGASVSHDANVAHI